MTTRIHQKVKIPHTNTSTLINNTYPNKKVVMKNLPPNTTIVVKKNFLRKDLKSKMAQIKSSANYQKGVEQYRAKFKRRIKSS